MRATEFIVEGVAEGFPQPGPSSGAPQQFGSDAKIQTRQMTVKDIISSVPGVPYYNNVVDDWDSKDYSWGVTKKVIEYATYLKDHPESLAKLPPAIVLNGKFEDGAHRVSAIWLLQQRMDPKNPLWKNAKLNVQFVKQGVAEGYSNTTFNVDRRKLNVPALIQKGAILVTHPHGEQGWETDNKEDWAFSLISLYNVLHGGWTTEAKKYLKPASYKKAEQQINSSAPNLGSDKLVYDGKYNQILWSIKKLGIPDNVAFLDKDQQGVAEAGNANSGRRGPDYQDNSPVVPGRVEHLPQGLRHHADASRYGGTEPDDKDDRLLGPQQRHRLHRAVTPDDLDEQEKIAGRHDPDDFDDMIGRLQQLAGAGPLKTVWDPAKRVYKNVPHAVQPAQQPKKAPQ